MRCMTNNTLNIGNDLRTDYLIRGRMYTDPSESVKFTDDSGRETTYHGVPHSLTDCSNVEPNTLNDTDTTDPRNEIAQKIARLYYGK